MIRNKKLPIHFNVGKANFGHRHDLLIISWVALSLPLFIGKNENYNFGHLIDTRDTNLILDSFRVVRK
jgi:hypothetical protein